MLLVLKWGGELTPAGRVQAEELGRAFRCMYPGGQGETSTQTQNKTGFPVKYHINGLFRLLSLSVLHFASVTSTIIWSLMLRLHHVCFIL